MSVTANPVEPPEKPPVKVADKSPVVKVASKDVSMTDNGSSKSLFLQSLRELAVLSACLLLFPMSIKVLMITKGLLTVFGVLSGNLRVLI